MRFSVRPCSPSRFTSRFTEKRSSLFTSSRAHGATERADGPAHNAARLLINSSASNPTRRRRRTPGESGETYPTYPVVERVLTGYDAYRRACTPHARRYPPLASRTSPRRPAPIVTCHRWRWPQRETVAIYARCKDTYTANNCRTIVIVEAARRDTCSLPDTKSISR